MNKQCLYLFIWLSCCKQKKDIDSGIEFLLSHTYPPLIHPIGEGECVRCKGKVTRRKIAVHMTANRGTRILGMYAEGRTGKVTRRKIAVHMTANGGTRILGMYAEGRTGKVTRRATAEHMTANGGAGLSIGGRETRRVRRGRTGNRKDSTTVSCKHQDSNGVVSEW